MITNIKEITSIGPTQYDVELDKVLEFLKQKTSQNAMWLFIDGVEKNADTLTVDDILNSQSIVLTNKLLGG